MKRDPTIEERKKIYKKIYTGLSNNIESAYYICVMTDCWPQFTSNFPEILLFKKDEFVEENTAWLSILYDDNKGAYNTNLPIRIETNIFKLTIIAFCIAMCETNNDE